jgi:hypothetical protein
MQNINNLDLARTLHDINKAKIIPFESTDEYKKTIKLLGGEKIVKRFEYFFATSAGLSLIPCAIFLLSLINKDLTILEILKNKSELLPPALLMSGIGISAALACLYLLIYAILTLISEPPRVYTRGI